MTTKSTTDTTTATIFNEQPIFIGRDTQALIYLCKDGLYAFVAPSMRDLYAAACAEPTIGPHHFAAYVEVIRVNGIHADRLRSEAQLPAVPACRPDVTAAGVAMEFADFVAAYEDIVRRARDGIAIRVCATPDKKDLTGFAMEAAQFEVKFFNDYFGIRYPFGRGGRVPFEGEFFGILPVRNGDLVPAVGKRAVDHR